MIKCYSHCKRLEIALKNKFVYCSINWLQIERARVSGCKWIDFETLSKYRSNISILKKDLGHGNAWPPQRIEPISQQTPYSALLCSRSIVCMFTNCTHYRRGVRGGRRLYRFCCNKFECIFRQSVKNEENAWALLGRLHLSVFVQETEIDFHLTVKMQILSVNEFVYKS